MKKCDNWSHDHVKRVTHYKATGEIITKPFCPNEWDFNPKDYTVKKLT